MTGSTSSYYSNVDHPHIGPIYTPESSPKPADTTLYQPSHIPHCKSPQPISKKSSSPKIVLVQQS